MTPPHPYNSRDRGHPYHHQHRYPPHGSHHGERQDAPHNHGGRGRGGQGWNQSNRHHHHNHNRPGSNASYGNQGQYNNNRPGNNGRDHYGHARVPRKNHDGNYPQSYVQPSESHNGRGMAEPQVVNSQQGDDRKPAAADDIESRDTTPFHGNDGNCEPEVAEVASKPDTQFEKMEYKDQLIAQIPSSEDKAEFIKKLPVDIYTPDSRLGEERKQSIVQEMVEEFRKERELKKKAMTEEELEDEDEIEEREEAMLVGDWWDRFDQTDRETERIVGFILALPSCLLLTAGFHVWAGSVRCFCPCSGKMEKWRKLANCSVDLGDVCSKKGDFNDPNGLMDHLGEKAKTSILHAKVKEYLEKLFADYWGPNISHKGLYKKASPEYIKADVQEKRDNNRKMIELQEQFDAMAIRDEERKKRKKAAKKLEEVNPDKAKLLKNQIFKNESPPPSVDDMMPHYKAKLREFWSIFDVDHKKDDERDERTFEVKHDFCLQEVFDEWSTVKSPKFFPFTFLFKEKMTNADQKKLLSRPKVDFAVNVVCQVLSAEVKEEVQARDEGGPETQFFSQVWQMMPTLKVSSSDGSKSIALFENTPGGYSPMPDYRFSNLNCPELENKAKLYYRALGRLFVNCLSMRRTVPDHVLPMLYRNAILRDCMPTSPEYCGKALCIHLITLGWTTKSINYLKEELLSEEKFREDINDPSRKDINDRFREDIYDRFIKQRSIWFASFKEGVTVKDRVPISVFYGLIPLKAVNRVVFGTQKITAQDVIGRLVATYSEEPKVESQRLLFNDVTKEGALSDILMKWAYEETSTWRTTWLHSFLEFCTGQYYLPHISVEFKIYVVFEVQCREGNSTHEDRCPESYTCVNQLCLPLQAYDGNPEKLEQKLRYSVEGSDQFSMN